MTAKKLREVTDILNTLLPCNITDGEIAVAQELTCPSDTQMLQIGEWRNTSGFPEATVECAWTHLHFFSQLGDGNRIFQVRLQPPLYLNDGLIVM